jgi:rhomboid family GlyGly-CTERM serine protease
MSAPRRWLAARRITLCMGALAIALALPGLVRDGGSSLPAALELRDTFTTDAEPWRLLTGHLVHLNGRQLMMNLISFVWLGCLCEPRMQRRYGTLLVVSALTVSAGVLHAHPDLVSYRGLSGVASAQFAAVVALRLRDGLRSGRTAPAVPPLVALLLFLGKTAFEVETGRALFAGTLALGAAAPSPAAHLFGAIAGLAVALLPAAHSLSAARPAMAGAQAHGSAARVG